jgi:hypothetical protein
MTMNSFLQAAGAVGIIGGAILTLALVLQKFVWSPVRKALIEEVKSELECRLAPILKLVSQLETNGGSHLADRIIRLEERQSSVVTRLDDVYDLVKSMKEIK